MFRRANDTIRYIRDKLNIEKNEKEGRSCLLKCGSMCKTFVIFAIVAALLIPAFMETYNRFMKTGDSVLDAKYDTINLRDEDEKPETPADIARRA